MKKVSRHIYLCVSSLFIFLLHIPFSVAKSAGKPVFNFLPTFNAHTFPIISNIPSVKSVYDNLHLDLTGLSRQAFDLAMKGFDKLVEQGKIANDALLSIVDFSLPSSSKRFFTLDLQHSKFILSTLVAHGKNSGLISATSFSNEPLSEKSSLGFYITGQSYQGANGYSLKLRGVEKGFNDHVEDRSIVIHGADYVCQEFIDAQGYIGRSQGCPAVPRSMANKIIHLIKGGSCLFVYAPVTYYLTHSKLLR